ncbi:MAG: o-succinylbenzoate--CoA ligase [Kineosporiaceae bacterium]
MPAPRELLPLRLPDAASGWTRPLLDDVLAALRAGLSGTGPAVRPLEPGRSAVAVALTGLDDDPQDPTAAAVATSGSTGTPRLTLLPASALLASVSATHDHLGGPGHWALALPVHHVAGLQVLYRSLVAGTVPVPVASPDGFRAAAFADAVDALAGPRRYSAVVPTQLTRLLDDPRGLAALRALDAVLVGGAATPPALLQRAREAGVAVVTTYGMSETCGGCVYDGVPLDGVLVELDDDGRIVLGGPVLARGYLDLGPRRHRRAATSGFAWAADGTRRFLTSDRGSWDGERLAVHGRLDDVVVTGGEKVDPAAVEAVLVELDGVSEAVVVGVPDPHWGQAVAAGVVLAPGAQPPDLDAVRDLVGRRLGRAAAPRVLRVLPELPVRGPGKPDREAARHLLG